MEWKFSCESRDNIKLPPEYLFPEALNYLNSETNSFYILENESGYVQVAGNKLSCTVEYRSFLNDNKFAHYVFFDPSKSSEKEIFKMTNGTISREQRHSFNFIKAAKILKSYFEGNDWPNFVKLEDITSQFNSE